MADILTGPTPTELWRELVREGEERSGARLDEDTESYLVFTLMRHDRDAPLASRIMAIEFLSALERGGRLREQDLRDVGDRCLLIAGLYPELAERRRVSQRYFVELGQHAYDELAHATRAALADLYARLVRLFARLVRVLIEVRQIAAATPVLDPLSRHELALAAGDDVAMRDFPGAIVIPGSSRAN